MRLMQATKRMRFLAFLLLGTLTVALIVVNEAQAAVAHDAASESHTATTGSASQASFTWTHTPVGTPRGVLVFVYTISATSTVTSVTYGGVAMTAVSGGAAIDAAGEPGRVDTFFLGAGIPTGAQSVIVNRTNNAVVMYATAITQTAAADTEVTGIILLQADQTLAEQSVTDGSPGINSVRYAGAYSGLNTLPPAGANSTLLHSIDFGNFGALTARETTAGQGARLVGFTAAASDDAAAVHLAVRERSTTIATGTDPGATTIAPSGAVPVATDVNLFTLQTGIGTETITSVAVNLSTNNGVGRLAITDNANTELGFTITPATGSNTITVAGMSAGTTLTTFKVRITPLSHVDPALPVPPGGAYAITAPVTSWAGNYTGHVGSDTNTVALTIDNESPGVVTGPPSGTVASGQVTLNWINPTTPAETVAYSIVVLRSTATVVATPVEGTTYVVGDTIGASTVACVVTGLPPALTCTDTGLTNGTSYHYKIFTRDSNVNYSATGVVPTGSPFLPSSNRYAVASTSWNTVTTWSTASCAGGGSTGVPLAGDSVTICATRTVTLDTDSASLSGLTIESTGVLNIGNNATARTLTVTGGVSNAGTLRYNTTAAHVVSIGGALTNSGTLTVAAVAGAKTLTVTGLITNSGTFRYAGTAALTVNANGGISNSNIFDVDLASNVTHVLNVGDDVANTGTFNLATDAASLCNTTFNRNGNQTVSGAGATTRFNLITVNMGTTNANILDITATNFSINPLAPTNFLTLTNGTFKFSTTGTITPFTAAPAISATRGFWLNNASATVSSGNFDWTVTGTSTAVRGLVRVSSGTFTLGAAGGNDLITGNFSDIVIEGGTINIGGALARAAAADNVRFNMSGGTLTVGAAGAPGNFPFRMEAAASFTMSAGTIVVRRDGGGNGYQNLAATSSVTGGTLQIGDASTPAGQTMGINSTVPVGTLLINSANATGDLQAALTVNGNVTITAGTLTANAFGLTLGGNWSRTGTFTAGTGTVTFNGSAAQGITGVTTFANLVINNATGVTANSNPTITRNFTNTAGFNAGTTTTTFGGTVVQILTGITTFYDLVFNNAAGFTFNNDMTASNTLTLTSGVIATGINNTLVYSSTSSCSVTRTTGRVNGNLRKNFTASLLTCNFEIGDAADYTPVNVAFSATGFSAGTVTAKATLGNTGGVHPQIATAPLDSTTPNLVNRYWMLTPGGGLAFSDVTLSFSPVTGDHDNTANVGNYTIQRYEISGGPCDTLAVGYTGAGSWIGATEPPTPPQTTTLITATGITTFGSICSHFAIGVSSISGFLYEKEFIYQREIFY